MSAGVPVVNLHGPWHEVGIVDPLCGGTRAAYYTARGDLSAAWRYNPAGILAVLAAALASVRAAVGMLVGRWATVSIAWTRRRAAVMVLLLVAALVALQVRQQMQAEMLLAPWSGR
ncbi:DUF2752 domain-containing protein [Nocardioides caldifontis]|uniref:DUF2752 domain-containing protein n=1 Tax=Nocardioides caldifontis TaxID=2588938 RepID=UPI00139696C5|nr:DUF2752 domain-containing protein [Nocardioides caldifontis]